MIEITKQTIVASDGNFEEHPESYRPRVFMETCTNLSECYLVQNPPVEPIMAVFELLADGKAIQWPSFPDKATCGFDYWKLYAPLMNCIAMVRATRVLPTEVEVQGKKFPLFIFPKDLANAIRIIDTNDTSAVSQADGFSDGPLAHLPEGSH